MGRNKIELLSPAGDMLSLKAAVNNGCNAVYLGGQSFNARSSATNFNDDELIEAIKYCYLRDVKVFVVVNILYKDAEINELFEFLNKVYKAGADAFIVQDIGLAMFIKQNFKDIKLHASTQLNAHSLLDVLYLQSLGFDRVILARELSLKEIEEIKSKVKIEIEVFGHGALCVSNSGQCLMSSFIGKRSGNRGKCAGTCRLKFDLEHKNKVVCSGHLLSTKDLMTLDVLEDLEKIGVDSIKLEGRMKNYEYVGLITKLYREHIDTLSKISDENKKMVTQIFNRGGELTSGYLTRHSGTSMMSTETPKSSGVEIGFVRHYSRAQGVCTIRLTDDVIGGDGIEIWTSKKPHVGTNINKKANAGSDIEVKIKGDIQKGDKVYKSYDKALNDLLKNSHKDTRQQQIYGTVIAKLNEPIKLILFKDDVCIEVEGDIVELSQNAPMTENKIVEKLSKTGNTPFKIFFNNNEIGENIYINISSINKLKREALQLFEEKYLEKLNRFEVSLNKHDMPKYDKVEEKYLTVHVTNKKMMNKVVNAKPYRIYLEYYDNMQSEINEYIKMCKDNDIQFFVAFPKITDIHCEKKLENFINHIKEENILVDGYCISNYGQRYLLSKKDKITYDYNFNLFNSLTLKFLTKFDNKTVAVLSPELSLAELKQLSCKNSEVVIHGKLPVMLTKQCPVGLYVSNKGDSKYCEMRGHNEYYYLKDRVDDKFLIKCNCDECNAEILNSKYLFMLNKFDDLKNINTKFYKIVLTDEREVTKLLMAYKKAINGEKDIAFDDLMKTYKEKGTTYGNIYKGTL